MNASDYLRRSTLYRKLAHGPYGDFVDVYAAELSKEGFSRHSTWRLLSLFRDLMDWHVGNGYDRHDLSEVDVESFLDHRSRHGRPDRGDRSALRRLLSALRTENLIPAALPIVRTELEQIIDLFALYLSRERGLVASTVESHKLLAHRFLREVCTSGVDGLGALTPEIVIGYVKRHALDGFADSGKAMCGVVRAFLRYSHLKSFIATALADCVPSIRRCRLAGLQTFLPPEKVQKVLDACDRTTAMGCRDYAVLMILAKLGLRASEFATLNIDDIDWQLGTMLEHGKGRRQATKRILCQERVADRFVPMVLERAKAITFGDPMDRATQLGTVVHEKAAALFEKRVYMAAEQGAEVLYDPGRKGALLPPIVVDRVPHGSELVMEETFGPIIPIIRAPDDDDALIALSNSTAFGLSSGVCTNDFRRMQKYIAGLEVGTVNIWEVPGYRIEMSPFGGIKDSGNGYKEGVIEAMKSFTNVKTFSLPW